MPRWQPSEPPAGATVATTSRRAPPGGSRAPAGWGGATIAGYVLLAAAFAVHAAILLQVPVVGAPENGDFWRVTHPAGLVRLDAYEDVHHRYVSQHYGVVPARPSEGFSSAAAIALASRWLRPGAPQLDIRQMGVTYLLLFALACGAALWLGVPPLGCALLAWAALDVSYSLYLNSFFADGAAFLGMFAITLALLASAPATSAAATGRSRLAAVMLVAAALTAGLAKSHYALTPFVAAAALLVWPAPGWRAGLRARAARVAALLAAGALATWHFTAGSGHRFPAINHHHVVFYGLAIVTDEPGQALAALGVDAALLPFAGRTYFELARADRERSRAALADLSRTRVALAYLRQPAHITRAAQRLGPPLRQVVTADPNFSDRTRPPSRYRGWWQFARLRGDLTPLAVAVWLAGAAWLARAAWQRTWDGRHAALAFLFANAGVLVVLSVLGDGFFALHRHTMGARFSLDLALALLLWVAAAALGRRLRASRTSPN